MILKTKVPGRVVTHRVQKFGRWYVQEWFRFDDKGLAEIDETKLTQSDINKLKAKFEVVDTNLKDLSYQELKKMASDKGINTYKKGKKQLLKELGV